MYSSVSTSYDGQAVFITGGTGFIGKTLLEKLLYSCPGIEKVYILIREKKNISMQQRIQNILELPLFSRLRDEKPDTLKKIIPIAGDISESNLGISADDEQLLIDDVSIVFHGAATVKFNEDLDIAMNLNVAGTRRVLNLTKRMKNIKALVYVSTTFSHSERQIIEEVIYPAPASVNEVEKLLETGRTAEEKKQIIGIKPNTYTFTKSLAENFIAENHGSVPAVIIRPAIVSASKGEPIPGWTDSWNGATAFLVTVCKGLTRVLLASPTNTLDLVPVDYVINLMIVAASKCERSRDVAVYNCSSSGENPITIGHFSELIIKDSHKHKFYDFPMPFVIMTQSKWLVYLLTLLLQIVPAYIADILLWTTGKPTRYIRMNSRMLLLRDASQFITSSSRTASASATTALARSLPEPERRLFPCDPSAIRWDEYVATYCLGVRQFLLKK